MRYSLVCRLRGWLLIAILLVPLCSQAKEQKGRRAEGEKGKPNHSTPYTLHPTPILKGEDVVATVEGQPITRRELTYYWIQVDKQMPPSLLGGLLTERWKADKGASRTYSVSVSELYARLYGDKNPKAADVLSSLISNRLVAIEAKRRGINVTKTQAQAYAHELLEQFRKAQGIQESDEQLMIRLRLPRDVFLDDMTYRVQSEKLLALEIARINGHPLRPDDWLILQQVHVPVTPSEEPGETEKRFAEAKTRIETLLKMVRGGKSLEDAAREYGKEALAGRTGAVLHGTGTPSVEEAIAHLKPHAVTEPLRLKDGWYLFAIEARGTAIPEAQRTRAWQQVVVAKFPAYLITLRKRAKVTSTIPLPPLEPPPAGNP